ncbi:hypothetical protein EJ02DRAFT_457472 [Clathrospora elynae]|uniref:Uncharacterized protein n=1 Tax=Clathrospora elynae TaxID=706981 RepID=A0A6A5SGA3_9PLEO|nr:hypothetical protein EJ02DRAFT_457472 [Clathrospora elynae]
MTSEDPSRHISVSRLRNGGVDSSPRLTLDTRNGLRLRHAHAPASISVHTGSAHTKAFVSHNLLSTGPAGYVYTPLYVRTPGLESFSDDFGVRFESRLSFCRLVWRWCLNAGKKFRFNKLKTWAEKKVSGLYKQ